MPGTKCPTVRSGGTTRLRSALMPTLMTSRASMEFFLPSPVVGEGGADERGEFARVRGWPRDQYPSPAFDASHLRHPLPQGERENGHPTLFLREAFDKGHAALHLVDQWRFVDLDHDGFGIDAEILHKRLGDIAHHADLLFVGASGGHANGDFGHSCSPHFLLVMAGHSRLKDG